MPQNRRHPHRLGRQPAAWFLTLLALLVLSSCNRESPPTITTPQPEPTALESLPERQTSAVVRPDEGGRVGLRDGVEVALPRESIVDTTVLALRVADNPPEAPVPRNIIGKAYEFSIEGSELTGVAMVTLPLPPGVDAAQYDLAPYRWNGQAWERLAGRITDAGVKFGLNKPSAFALLGEWRMADASLQLAAPPTEPGRQSIQFEVTGRYRYSAPPQITHDYTEATLLLKRDSSGGAGQVSGEVALDKTVAESVLWFKPDPAQAQGVIEFAYTFELSPQQLDVPLGEVSRLYALLVVADSAAPTRRLSSGTDYTQVVPIHVLGSDVIRPELAPGLDKTLRWHVRLNGQTLFVRPATELRLSLAEALAMGGLGEYRISLESESTDKFMPVSNEVTVQLALPVTATPVLVVQEPEPGEAAMAPSTAVATPTVWPFGTMPPTPTRRTPPQNGAATSAAGTAATATPTATAQPTATRPPWANDFYADAYTLPANSCTTLYWNIENIAAITFNGSPTEGVMSRRECIEDKARTFTLHITEVNGKSRDRRITIGVQTTEDPDATRFWADDYLIANGACTTLNWYATGVTAVRLDGQGVEGVSSKTECPKQTTVYELKVERGAEDPLYFKLRIVVVPADAFSILFWAEQYTLRPESCTVLHWQVQNVQSVHLLGGGEEKGVAGEGHSEVICPTNAEDYTLRVVDNDGHQEVKTVHLEVTDRDPDGGQIVAQGIVNEVTFKGDLDDNAGGDQPGWEILVDGVNTLFGTGDSDATVRLRVNQGLVTEANSTWLDWPIEPGQQVEFRAACDNSTCTLNQLRPPYLRLISP